MVEKAKKWLQNYRLFFSFALLALSLCLLLSGCSIEDIPNGQKVGEKIIAALDCSHSRGQTVHPGGEVTYTVRLQNTGFKDAPVEVRASVPECAEHVSGGSIDGHTLVWEVTIPARETLSVSYTIRVLEDMELCEEGYVTGDISVNGTDLVGYEVYIKRTLNRYDREKVVTGMRALNNSKLGGMELVNWVYQIAFSTSVPMEGTPAEILEQIYAEDNSLSEGMAVPGFYGGQAVEASMMERLPGAPSVLPAESDLIAGDVILVHEDITGSDKGRGYLYDGEDLYELLEAGMVKSDTASVLGNLLSADRYIALRPSMVLESLNYTEEKEELVLTPEQEAVIVTAESYLLRGERVQYDDSRMTDHIHRWQKGVKSPEDYTGDEWGYTNCAAFTYDVYLNALGYDIGMYETAQLISADSSVQPYYYMPTGMETEQEKLAVYQEFTEMLQPGDIIVYRYREKSGGHAMLYVGNGNIVHSTGSSYDAENGMETVEPTVRYLRVDDLFTLENSRRHIFTKTTQLAIVRPLAAWSGEIPENTVNRVENMQGLVAEKLSSHASGMTVSPGGEMTFTFSVYNAKDEAATVEIRDVVPEHTTYVGGADTVEGDQLFWQLTIPAGETGTVSYTVKVDEDEHLTEGGYIYSDAGTVGGVRVVCPRVYVKQTLDAEQQAALGTAIEALDSSGLTGLAYVNAAYENAFGESGALPSDSIDELLAGVWGDDTSYKLNKDGQYIEMVAPTLYGGRKCVNAQLFNRQRTRLVRENQLIVGDVILAGSGSDHKIYLYTGEGLLDVTHDRKAVDVDAILESILMEDYFVVLRPSAIR
ncbi:MAG: DUF11 domain-containing protein [Lachnospiraceae bacterium]|nr:DUF11 domain-containing protein [Lachnospiraceae bacterium]